jgi:proline-specific peptidase
VIREDNAVSTATVNGIKLYYEVTGKNKALVMLHGYVGDIEDFRNQINYFSPNYKIYALDQRGRGKSEAPKNPTDYSMKLFVDDVYQWLKLLKVQKFCLVGHSLGGMVSLEFALAHQDMLSCLILTDTSSGSQAPTLEETAHLEKVFEVARTKGTGSAFEYDLANSPATKARYQKHPETLDRMRKKTLSTPVDGYINVRLASMNRKPVTDRLNEIKVPTLIVYGGDDTPFISASKVLKEGIPNLELVMIPNVGHGPMYEDPNKYNEAISKFLNRVGW